jgi:hypothetical protein
MIVPVTLDSDLDAPSGSEQDLSEVDPEIQTVGVPKVDTL